MRWLILDRDGTLNRDDNGYVHRVEDFELMSGVVSGLLQFKNAGFQFVIVTNQAGIAKGKFTEPDMMIFNYKLTHELARHGILIAATFYCRHHPEITGPCFCRKPDVGMVKQAETLFGFDSSRAIFIGDKDSDIQLGKNCGGTTVLIKNDQYENLVEPDFRATDLLDAFNQLKASGRI